MTAAHILQDCEQHAVTRDKHWPTPTTLEAKLYGDLGALKTTAAYIKETGLII